MKRLLAAALLIAGCKSAPPPKEVSASALVDRLGDFMETAVAVPADAPNGGLDFENDWLLARFGKFRRYFGGVGVQNGRRYDVVKIELPNGEKKTVFFDITENWNRGG
ncbi:MAG TPA: hypothetical protein VER58_00095 [Thermoanaerobaculia bacterium]|nr:hypothetical protein [Thermoanaerobaculia bacterium]